MNTIEQPVPDLAADGAPVEAPSSEAIVSEPAINGFDGGTRPIYREPSLYLSIAIVLIATSVCLSKTPTVFWSSLAAMTTVAVMFHIMAERFLFSAKKEHESFAAPFEGVFVLTLGAILPGLSLLAYGFYSVSNSMSTMLWQNFVEEFAKLVLLLVVPFFNFVVWSSVRKRYLVRPRLIGLMNGFAFGLSASWSAIWVSSVVLASSSSSCKFGWMLLLCTAPFLLFSAFCLSLDLWHKTEANIRRITSTFSVLGILLSLLFVFAPMARAFFVQSLVTGVRQAPEAEQGAAVSTLRSVSTDEDLRPAKYPLSGFALAELLIPNRGFENGTETDRDLYFKVTGKSYFAADRKEHQSLEEEQALANPVIGGRIAGLSLAKSQISGTIDAATLSSSVDWTLTFHNSSASPQEARCEIAIPKEAAVSRVTLWVDGVPREGAFASTTKVQGAYRTVVNQQRDPLLVTMSAPDRVLIQCFPVPASGGELKIRIGFKSPLETIDGKDCSLKLPQMMASNFAQLKRHRLSFSSPDLLLQNLPGILVSKGPDGYSLTGILKASSVRLRDTKLSIRRTTPFAEVATLDWFSRKPRYIVERLREVVITAPKRVFVVIDPSSSLRGDAFQIRQALALIPARFNPIVSFAGKQAQVLVNADAFEGGQDNWPTLRETLETAAERPNSVVVWIHGPQPIAPKLVDSAVLDLVHRVSLYDLQIEPGVNAILPALQMEDVSGLIACEEVVCGSIADDVKSLLLTWDGTKSAGTKRLAVDRTLSVEKPACPIVSDRIVSAQVSCLWAKGEVAKLIAGGHQQEAQQLASSYRLATLVTGAVVLENAEQYKSSGLAVGAYKDALGRAANWVGSLTGGIVGAPVDPRYGQSNEVGQLADYGYDRARDFSRLLTALSLLISLVVAIVFVSGRKVRTWSVYAKAVGLVTLAPTVVHLIGTFMINSCGGLGGGL